MHNVFSAQQKPVTCMPDLVIKCEGRTDALATCVLTLTLHHGRLGGEGRGRKVTLRWTGDEEGVLGTGEPLKFVQPKLSKKGGGHIVSLRKIDPDIYQQARRNDVVLTLMCHNEVLSTSVRPQYDVIYPLGLYSILC